MLADVWMDGPRLAFGHRNPKELLKLETAILDGHARSVWIPIVHAIDKRLMSRFLAKVAVEILAQRLMKVDGWEEALIDDPQLDLLRRYARIGDKPASWPCSHRRIYGENDLQIDAAGGHQVLHEFTLLYTETRELYAVLCFFDEEFAINFGGPQIDGYGRWLAAHQGQSPLYIRDKLPVSRLGNECVPQVGNGNGS